MQLQTLKYFHLLLIAALFCFFSNAQNLGAPILNVTFGVGNSNPNTIGPSLQQGNTSFTYSPVLCPAEGQYTIMRRINVLGCFNDEWIPLSSDNTPYPDDYGFMMIVNNYPLNTPKLIFSDTVKTPLCSGAQYNFSAALINIDKQTVCSGLPDFPHFIFNVETTTGQIIKTDTSGPFGFIVSSFGYKFGTFGSTFTMPSGINEIVLKIKVNSSGSFSDCGDDFAIDDIQLRPVGPELAVGFAGVADGVWVKSVCYQDNKTISMTGSISPGNFAMQWQQSIDDGINWTDITGATTSALSLSFPIADTFLIRLRASVPAFISNPNCSSVSNVIKVEVDGIPSEYSVTNNSPICAGHDLIFNAEGGAKYLWTGPNGFTETSPFPHIYLSTLADSGKYYVQVISLGGCKATDSTYVTMMGIDVDAGPDRFICKGQTIQLHVDGGINYLWSPVTGLSNARSANPRVTPEVTTKYSVTVTDQFGCSNTASVTINLLNSIALKAEFSNTENICKPYDSVSFKNLSEGEIVSWVWDFGNGQTSTQANPSTQEYFISNNTTRFPVRLTVTDTSGCSDSISHVINVVDNCYIAVPTAFSPNGDGLNDYLYPLNAYKATNLLFRVFNRNGVLMFETKDWTKRWDGTYKGLLQGSGVFVWTLDYIDAGNKKVSLKGTTLLIR